MRFQLRRECRQNARSPVDDAENVQRSLRLSRSSAAITMPPETSPDDGHLAVRLNVANDLVGAAGSRERLDAAGVFLRAGDAVIVVCTAQTDRQPVVGDAICYPAETRSFLQVDLRNFPISDEQSRIAGEPMRRSISGEVPAASA